MAGKVMLERRTNLLRELQTFSNEVCVKLACYGISGSHNIYIVAVFKTFKKNKNIKLYII